jgi:hypothetical protein
VRCQNVAVASVAMDKLVLQTEQIDAASRSHCPGDFPHASAQTAARDHLFDHNDAAMVAKRLGDSGDVERLQGRDCKNRGRLAGFPQSIGNLQSQMGDCPIGQDDRLRAVDAPQHPHLAELPRIFGGLRQIRLARFAEAQIDGAFRLARTPTRRGLDLVRIARCDDA